MIGPVIGADRPTVSSLRAVHWWDSLPGKTRVVVVTLPVALAAVVSWFFGWGIGQHHGQFDLRLYYDAVNYWLAGNDLFSYSQPDPVNIELGFTYPPLGAVVMAPMGLLTYPAVLVLTLAAIVAATVVFVFLVLRERVQLPKPLMYALAGVGAAAAFTLEPFRQTFSFGQVNVFLGLLVLLDLLVLARRGSRWTGVGIGLATAIKLTPGIFIVYLLVIGRWRAAVTAMISTVAFTLFGAVFTPAETWHYFTSLIWETTRVGFLDSTMNQSVNGLLARLDSPLQPDRMAWVLIAGALAVIGLWRARRAVKAGDELAGLTLAGLVGLLVSPVTWVHHAVWIFPAMLILAVRVTSSIQSLVRDDGRSQRALTARIVEVVTYSVLFTAGVVIWCTPTATLVDVHDRDYAAGGALLAFAGSVQMLWMVITLLTLPVLKHVAGVASGSGAVPHAVDGTIPPGALRTRIVMPVGDGANGARSDDGVIVPRAAGSRK